MNKAVRWGLVGLTAVLTVALVVKASETPFGPSEEKIINTFKVERTLRVPYDVAEHGGSVTAHGLGQALPAGAIITQAWTYIVTQFSDSGSGTVAISCEDANNILTAQDPTGSAAGVLTAAAATGTAAAMVKSIAANCEVTATVGGVAQDAGRMLIFIRYVVGE